MKHKNKTYLSRFIVLAILVLLLIAIANKFSVADVKEHSQDVQNSFYDTSRLDEIRNRENIKKQQELIVQETYLLEDKDRIQAEKNAAIAKYDAQLTDIEKSLETVRASKLSF